MKFLQEKAEKMTKKIWEGRLEGKASSLLEAFSASLETDIRLYAYDITGTAAYIYSLFKSGLISRDEAKKCIDGLETVKINIEKGLYADIYYEDIHSLVENELKNIIGESAGKIHTGRSRNDQIVLDEKLFLKQAIVELSHELKFLLLKMIELAERYREIIIPAYTHLQRAQPVLFSHYLLSYFEKFARDMEKLFINFDDADSMPLGSGACCGSGYAVKRELLAGLMKFSKTGENSMDEVSGRDYFTDFLYTLSAIMLHMSRLCEDLIIYSTNEFSFVDLPDELCTGSSIMPQKKNPDVLELIRGKSAVVSGNLLQLMMLQKGLPSTYNRDLQEDKKIVFSAYDETIISVKIMSEIIIGLKLNEKKINENINNGFIEATDAADYLVKKGETFRNAHNIIGRLVKHCIKNNISLKDLVLSELKDFCSLFENDFYDAVMIEACINSKQTDCGTGEKYVGDKIKKAFDRISNYDVLNKKLNLRLIDYKSVILEIKNALD